MNKIQEKAASIKEKLSLENYDISTREELEAYKKSLDEKSTDNKKEPKVKSLKRSYYLDPETCQKVDKLYAEELVSKRAKVARSDIVIKAINLLYEKEISQVPASD